MISHETSKKKRHGQDKLQKRYVKNVHNWMVGENYNRKAVDNFLVRPAEVSGAIRAIGKDIMPDMKAWKKRIEGIINSE
jgi:hypothetical protein